VESLASQSMALNLSYVVMHPPSRSKPTSDGSHRRFLVQRAETFYPGIVGKLPTFIPSPWLCLRYVYPAFTFDPVSQHLTHVQILTGTTPFPVESEEEIVKGVIDGLRPKWPSNNSSQGLVNALRKQVDACWNQKPEERPIASEVLKTLLGFASGGHAGAGSSSTLYYGCGANGI
jgi:hypothetical protein